MKTSDSKMKDYYWLAAICPQTGDDELVFVLREWFEVFKGLDKNPRCAEFDPTGKCLQCKEFWTNSLEGECDLPCNLSQEI